MLGMVKKGDARWCGEVSRDETLLLNDTRVCEMMCGEVRQDETLLLNETRGCKLMCGEVKHGSAMQGEASWGQLPDSSDSSLSATLRSSHTSIA